MKTRIALTIALLVIVPMFTSSAKAQEQMLFRVNIPFEFVAGGAHLSAGDYIAFHASPSIIQLVREDGRASAWAAVKASPVMAGGTNNQLIFNKYGDSYFLAKVQTGGDQQLHECFRCRAEQTLAARSLATGAQTVTIAAK